MAGFSLNVNFKLERNLIPQFIDGTEYATQRAILDAGHQVVSLVEPYTPYDPKVFHSHLNQPQVRQYGKNTVYVQWLAQNDGYYYAPIQNATQHQNYSTPGTGPGFMDAANEMLPKLALDYVERYMPKL